ncbi:hypothetical protein [Calycomorphotria hydatis]|uniref:Uncharacterized protein n=1 Tax=Calycomorphotria hydatis TaxID=2528027 RepID=A0A517T8Q5_9PLAN|nr:hypothetical protein [Calycomorphotria hydatis]QDT64756.1 hypothetical protein V22_19970 [Calycomorphotria hydatis]
MTTKEAASAAQRYHAALLSRDHRSPTLNPPVPAWSNCLRLAEKATRAKSLGYVLAARRLRRDYRVSLVTLVDFIDTERLQLDDEFAPRRILSPREITAELLSLNSEFPEVLSIPKRAIIRVTTEPVTLEGIELGSFEIDLSIDALHLPHPYEIGTTSPNPAASDIDCIHPHVRSRRLCEGEATAPIKHALADGRLADFFQVVSQTLQTYNPASAFTDLDRWHQHILECESCGDDFDADHGWCCNNCSSSLCGACHSYCPNCEEVYCDSCYVDCRGDECVLRICRSCHEESNGLCQECIQEQSTQSDAAASEATSNNSVPVPANSEEVTV